jgi:hypothetical protein
MGLHPKPSTLADFPEHLNKVGFSSDIVGKEISDHGQGDSGRKF